MSKRINQRIQNRFLQSHSLKKRREVYADGDWVSIKETLALTGWDAMQREAIHNHLKRGLSLNSAVKMAAESIGKCPIRAKIFF